MPMYRAEVEPDTMERNHSESFPGVNPAKIGVRAWQKIILSVS